MSLPDPPDQPPIPRVRASWLTRVWAGTVAALVLGYAAVGVLGLDVRTTEQAQIPGSVRSSPGGYRTFHFWHSGYHGGK